MLLFLLVVLLVLMLGGGSFYAGGYGWGQNGHGGVWLIGLVLIIIVVMALVGR